MRVSSRFIGLCLPPAVMAAFDCTFTLTGQSAQYWGGSYEKVNELSPSLHHLLALHPLAYVIGFAAWMLLFTCLILLLPQTLALAGSIIITLAHSAGAATWVLYEFRHGYQGVCSLFVFAGFLLAVGIRWGWGARPPPPGDAPALARLPVVGRWFIIAALFAVAVYLYLWPRPI